MTHRQADRFIRACVRYFGIGFHPDTRGAEYMDARTDLPCFTPERAARFDRRMAEAFTVCDPYDIAVRLMVPGGAFRGVVEDTLRTLDVAYAAAEHAEEPEIDLPPYNAARLPYRRAEEIMAWCSRRLGINAAALLSGGR